MKKYLIYLLLSSAVAQAYICDTAFLECNLSSEDKECLERHLACGRYETLYEKLSKKDMVNLTSEEKYLYGASLYGLQLRYADNFDLHCKYRNKAIYYLKDFLATNQKKYLKGKGFNIGSLDYIIGGTKKLKNLQAHTECPETPYSLKELQNYGYAYATKRLNNAFLGTGEDDGITKKLHTILRGMRKVLRSSITKASSLETGLSMGLVQYEATKKQIDKGIVEGMDGINKTQKDANSKIKRVQKSMNKAIGLFKEAVTIPPEEYNRKRKELLVKMQNSIKNANKKKIIFKTITNDNVMMIDENRSKISAISLFTTLTNKTEAKK